ncbi:hypothetical protein QCA50_017002 [Cerrena zonata]|uniref:2OGFeDO JBP1/TET oxygenase domain-containing protein n=1 Tax=Cerrena zonata TaxID=2478898 RepID=A0AAW0FRT7_9APHY
MMTTDRTALDRLHEYTGHMLKLFTCTLSSVTHQTAEAIPTKPPGMSDECARDCSTITKHMVRAFLNPAKVSWDMEAYRVQCAKRNIWGGMQQKEDTLANEFPSISTDIRNVRSARTVVDRYGRILMWILPGVLPTRLHDMMQRCTAYLEDELSSVPRGIESAGSWRFEESLWSYWSESVKTGLMNFSAAWFMNGWMGKNKGLVSSPLFRKDNGIMWCDEFFECGAILSGVLRIMHPDQYRMGYEVLKHLSSLQQVERALSRWPSIFNAITLISNRHCPMHRDNKGSFHLFDILVSTGSYSNAMFCCTPLGIQIGNTPGTIIGFSGTAFRHGVAQADGARVCHAFYMRGSLQEFSNVRPCSWMTQEVYRRWIGLRKSKHVGPLHSDPLSME